MKTLVSLILLVQSSFAVTSQYEKAVARISAEKREERLKNPVTEFVNLISLPDPDSGSFENALGAEQGFRVQGLNAPDLYTTESISDYNRIEQGNHLIRQQIAEGKEDLSIEEFTEQLFNKNHIKVTELAIKDSDYNIYYNKEGKTEKDETGSLILVDKDGVTSTLKNAKIAVGIHATTNKDKYRRIIVTNVFNGKTFKSIVDPFNNPKDNIAYHSAANALKFNKDAREFELKTLIHLKLTGVIPKDMDISEYNGRYYLNDYEVNFTPKLYNDNMAHTIAHTIVSAKFRNESEGNAAVNYVINAVKSLGLVIDSLINYSAAEPENLIDMYTALKRAAILEQHIITHGTSLEEQGLAPLNVKGIPLHREAVETILSTSTDDIISLAKHFKAKDTKPGELDKHIQSLPEAERKKAELFFSLARQAQIHKEMNKKLFQFNPKMLDNRDTFFNKLLEPIYDHLKVPSKDRKLFTNLYGWFLLSAESAYVWVIFLSLIALLLLRQRYNLKIESKQQR